MKFCFSFFFIKHIYITYVLFFFISFFESLFILGLFIPSSFIMFFIGILIGKKYLNFYLSYFLGILGCTLGDIISYYIGKFLKNYLDIFKKKLFIYSIIFKNLFFFFKRKTFFFIILNKFIGPFKLFIFFLSGMTLIPIYKILLPNFISTCLWSIVYLVPGVISGVAMTIPNSISFNIYLFSCMFLVFFNFFMFYQWFMLNNFNLYYLNLNKKLFVFFFIVFIVMLFYFVLNLLNNFIFNILITLVYKLLLNK